MAFAFWMYVSASAGACVGFLLASMFAVAKHADEQEERWLNENGHNGNGH